MKLKLTDIPIVYINLDEQSDRNESNKTTLNDLGLKNITDTLHIDTINQTRILHILILLLWRKLNTPFILLEDDCLPLNFIDEIDIPNDADAVYLGISSWGQHECSLWTLCSI